MTLHIVTMCTHNRTRSVLMGALLQAQLADLGVVARISTAGMSGDDLPATEPTVRLLAQRGIDVSAHRSTFINDEVISTADLVLTAEVQHVVFVAGRWEGAFARTFTLPELVQGGEAVGRRRDEPIPSWLRTVSEGRTAGHEYMSDPGVLEIADPTGQAPAVWRMSFDEIDALCHRLAILLA